MRLFGWIHVALGLLAIGSGAIALRGVLRIALSTNQVVRFLRYSLIASVVGFLPVTHRLSPIQGICMLAVYCSGAVVLSWWRFRLAGLWGPVFAVFIVVLLYLSVVSVSIRLFRYSTLFALASMESGSCFEIAQFLFASVFAVLVVLAAKKHHGQRTYRF